MDTDWQSQQRGTSVEKLQGDVDVGATTEPDPRMEMIIKANKA